MAIGDGTGGIGLREVDGPRFRLLDERRLEEAAVESSSLAHVPSTHPLVPVSSSSMRAASWSMTPVVGDSYARYRRLRRQK